MQAGAAEMLPPRGKTPGKVLKRPNTATAGPAKQAVARLQEPAAPSAATSAPGGSDFSTLVVRETTLSVSRDLQPAPVVVSPKYGHSLAMPSVCASCTMQHATATLS